MYRRPGSAVARMPTLMFLDIIRTPLPSCNEKGVISPRAEKGGAAWPILLTFASPGGTGYNIFLLSWWKGVQLGRRRNVMDADHNGDGFIVFGVS
jgi:hypothetical protein